VEERPLSGKSPSPEVKLNSSYPWREGVGRAAIDIGTWMAEMKKEPELWSESGVGIVPEEGKVLLHIKGSRGNPTPIFLL